MTDSEKNQPARENPNDWRIKHARMRDSGELPEAGNAPEDSKITIAEHGFKYWFSNYFWFHYRTMVISCSIALLLVAFFAYDIITKKDADLQYAFISLTPVSESSLAGLDSLAAQVLGDVNSDNEVMIQPQILFMDDESEMGVANRQRLPLLLVDDDIFLFIVDEEISAYFSDENEAFWNLAELGLPAESDRPWLMRADTLPMFKDIGLKTPHYIVFQCSDISENAKPLQIELYNRTVELLRALADGAEPPESSDSGAA